MTMHELGYRDTFQHGDQNAPVLKDELKKFEDDIESDSMVSRFYERTFQAFITPYGKQKIKEAFLFRIFYDDAPMTLLWRHPGGHTEDCYREEDVPKFQSDGITPAENKQMGGYKEKNGQLIKIAPYKKWYKFSNGFGSRRIGFWQVGAHYQPESYGVNEYEGDVKSAILASCLDDDDKQMLLDTIYQYADPVRKTDSYFCGAIMDYREGKREDYDVIKQELLTSDLPLKIKENLLLNLG